MTSHTILNLETTFPNLEKAKEISNILIKEKLVACAQISSPITSIYIWKDQLEQEQEINVSYKTINTSQHIQALEARLTELHPYELPQIIWKEIQSSKLYAHWVREHTVILPK